MAKCNWCGSEIPTGERICPKCKAEVSSNTSTNSNYNSNVSTKTDNEKKINITSIILKILGWITIGLSFLLIGDGIYFFIAGLISGIFIIGFGEIINLLNNINNKLK